MHLRHSVWDGRVKWEELTEKWLGARLDKLDGEGRWGGDGGVWRVVVVVVVWGPLHPPLFSPCPPSPDTLVMCVYRRV